MPTPRPKPRFAHGAEVEIGPYALLGCFHPSQQNTFTGRLAPGMMEEVLARAQRAVDVAASLWEDRRGGILGRPARHRSTPRSAAAPGCSPPRSRSPPAGSSGPGARSGNGGHPELPGAAARQPGQLVGNRLARLRRLPRREQPACPERVILEMYERWRPLSQSVRPQRRLRAHLPADDGGVLAHRHRRADVLRRRALGHARGRRLRAVLLQRRRRRARGRADPARRGGSRSTPHARPTSPGSGDLLLGMNAHINRDLAYTLASVGSGHARGHDPQDRPRPRQLLPQQHRRPAPERARGALRPVLHDDRRRALAARRDRRPADRARIPPGRRAMNAENLVEREQRRAARPGRGRQSSPTRRRPPPRSLAGNTIRRATGDARRRWCRAATTRPIIGAGWRSGQPARRSRCTRGRRLAVQVCADGPARFDLAAALNKPQTGPRSWRPDRAAHAVGDRRTSSTPPASQRARCGLAVVADRRSSSRACGPPTSRSTLGRPPRPSASTSGATLQRRRRRGSAATVDRRRRHLT